MESEKNIKSFQNIEVNIEIFAILLGVNKSMLNIDFGNGFKIEEVALDECRYKNKIINGDNSINDTYFFSQFKKIINSEEKVSFLCIKKNDKLSCVYPDFESDNPFFYEDANIYQKKQLKIINDCISKMQLFKEGDIGIYDIFIEYKGKHIFTNKRTDNIKIKDANNVCKNKYTINDAQIKGLNEFLTNHNQAFELLRGVIDCFTRSYKLTSIPKAFEQLITVNEMLFLKGREGKKEPLSKRMAVFLGNNDDEVKNIYNEIITFYKYRSDSTHEGIDTNITKQLLLSLREYSRKAIKKYLILIEKELSINSMIDFKTVKTKLILKIKEEVELKKSQNILPK